MLLGAAAFGYLEPTIRPVPLTGGPGKLTYDSLLGVPSWAAARVVAAPLVALLAEVGRDFDGALDTSSGSTPTAIRRCAEGARLASPNFFHSRLPPRAPPCPIP